jgi:type IV secretion system protein VirB4
LVKTPLGHTEILGTSNVGKTVLMMTKAYAAQQFGTPESFPPERKGQETDYRIFR